MAALLCSHGKVRTERGKSSPRGTFRGSQANGVYRLLDFLHLHILVNSQFWVADSRAGPGGGVFRNHLIIHSGTAHLVRVAFPLGSEHVVSARRD